jgi:hypothetical protein
MARLIGRSRSTANVVGLVISLIIVGAVAAAGYYLYLTFAVRFLG